jgi:hypothetical protein
MTEQVAQIDRMKRLDESRGRKPLRLRISRRLDPKRAEFVTQVRFGKKIALLVPRNAPGV